MAHCAHRAPPAHAANWHAGHRFPRARSLRALHHTFAARAGRLAPARTPRTHCTLHLHARLARTACLRALRALARVMRFAAGRCTATPFFFAFLTDLAC